MPSIRAWLRDGRVRRALAASAVVLATGGLVLFRASGGETASAAPSREATAAGSNAVAFSGRGAHGTLALSHGKVLAGATERVYAELRLDADPAEPQATHAPLAMVVVLDTSGSMSGTKLDQAEDAVVRLVRDMAPTDEIALVRYASEAETVQELARVQDVRDTLIDRVRSLSAGGGTAIPRGLSRGLAELHGSADGRVRRVVLVSDGLDSTRSEAERLASDSAERGVTVSSLGIGLDFDESYMGGVARSGHGNFGFVKDPGALATFLRRELTETAATTIESATVRFDLPSGVTFVRAYGGDARVDGSKVELHLGSLFAGDERRVVLELDAALGATDERALSASAAWTAVAGGEKVDITASRLALHGTSDANAAQAAQDPAVLADATSVVASTREVAAAEAYAHGDTATATRLIAGNVGDLRRAQAAAPPPVKRMLEKQIDSYDATRERFATSSPSSAAGKTAAKGAFETDFANLQKNAF